MTGPVTKVDPISCKEERLPIPALRFTEALFEHVKIGLATNNMGQRTDLFNTTGIRESYDEEFVDFVFLIEVLNLLQGTFLTARAISFRVAASSCASATHFVFEHNQPSWVQAV